jgi:tRNA (guanine37-N1)-methyltransferase
MDFDIITLFPEFFSSPLACATLRIALEKEIISVRTVNPRDLTADGVVDDYQFGGGAGMVLKPEPLARAITGILKADSLLVNLSPQGRRLDQRLVSELARKPHIVLICGRYKGIDERVSRIFEPLEVSIGDYVLSGGEAAALVLMEAVTRRLPGVLGNMDSAESDSLQDGLLAPELYTRPGVFRKHEVPAVLTGGNHRNIAAWRRKGSIKKTLERRPDLLSSVTFSKEDLEAILEVLNGENT